MKNSDMLNNLYKILRMNMVIAKSNGEIISHDTIQSFDDTAKKIDEEANKCYEEKLNDYYYATKTLDEEAERLEKLVNLIDTRIDDRNKLLSDYQEVTDENLELYSFIKDENKVEDYRIRLNDIRTYLSNKENIVKIEEELVELRSDLDQCFEDKKVDEEANSVLEKDLLDTFKSSVSGTEYADVVNAVDIDFELEKIRPDVDERLKTLNTFDNAYNNLLRAGISRDNEREYAGYVNDAKYAYYNVKEREFLYHIYKVILDSKSIYSDLFNKRDSLDNILEERLNLRRDLSISDEDILMSLYDIINKQNKVIVKEKNTIDKIDEVEEIIDFKDKRLNELKEDNRRVEILSLLQEFGIIDTYDSKLGLDEVDNDEKVEEEEKDSFEVEEKVNDDKEEEEIDIPIEKDKKEEKEDVDAFVPNMVVEVKDPYANFNVNFARSKADTVMRRVGKSLGYVSEPKKESLVSFDFNQEPVKEEANGNLIPVIGKVDEPVNNSLSNLNLDDLNLKLNLDNRVVDDEKVENVSNPIVNPLFPDIESNNNNDTNNVDNSGVDKDFWSAEEDKAIFPDVLANNNVSIDKEESGFKLGSPINIGGYDENRN